MDNSESRLLVYLELDRKSFELRRLLFEHPDIADILYKGRELPNKENRVERARCYALFEMILNYGSTLSMLYERASGKPESMWTHHVAWLRDLFSRSQELQNYYSKHSSLYHSALNKILVTVNSNDKTR